MCACVQVWLKDNLGVMFVYKAVTGIAIKYLRMRCSAMLLFGMNQTMEDFCLIEIHFAIVQNRHATEEF